MSKRIYVPDDKSVVIDPRSVLQKLGGDPAKVETLARKAGLEPDLLQRWMAGKTRLSASDQQKVAQALG